VTAQISPYLFIKSELAYVFQPIMFETLGFLNESTIDFVESIGRRFRVLFDDSRLTGFMLQRLSVCIQRFNSVILPNSFVVDFCGIN
jgi:hypothetical protein